MFEPFIPTEVDSFLAPFRLSLGFEVCDKAANYGYDFYDDAPLENTERFRWAEDPERLLPQSQATFASRRLRELWTEDLMEVMEIRSQQKAQASDQKMSLAEGTSTRSSLSTRPTLNYDDERYSASPFELDWSEADEHKD
jgi:hypothetical protein